MRKLYIIYYTAGQEFDFDHEWAKTEEEAEKAFIQEMWDCNEIKIARCSQVDSDCYIHGIYEVPKAINSQDLKKALTRFIIKPFCK